MQKQNKLFAAYFVTLAWLLILFTEIISCQRHTVDKGRPIVIRTATEAEAGFTNTVPERREPQPTPARGENSETAAQAAEARRPFSVMVNPQP